MNKPSVFARITKIDEAKRLVYMRIAEEVPDRADEIFDYETSKPYFEAWSKNQYEASGGKSYGNVRAMHGKVAAGILIEPLGFNDAQKTIDVVSKATDDQEWRKCLDGTYTGASIGGQYVGSRKAEKWHDGRELQRYTADPAEVSYVDSPCIPTAKFFEVIKADGTIEKVEFKPTPVEVTGTDDQVREFGEALNKAGLTLADAIGLVNKSAVLEKPLIESDTDEARSKNIATLITEGKSKEQAAAIAYDIQRKHKGKKKSDDPGELDKGMWAVQDFASCLASIASVAAAAESDMQWEGDASPVPEKLRTWLNDGVAIFKAMAKEEADELVASLDTQSGKTGATVVAMAQATRGTAALRKQLADPAITVAAAQALAKEYDEPLGDGFNERVLAKAAQKAKMSMEHKDRLQAAHDHLAAIGADCSAGEKSQATGTLAKATELQTQLTTALERIAKLEKQPVPYVTLRAVTKGAPAKAEVDLSTITLDSLKPQDMVKNADGSIDYGTSLFQAREKALAAAGNS